MDNSKSLRMVQEEGTATNPLRDTLKYVISDKCNATNVKTDKRHNAANIISNKYHNKTNVISNKRHKATNVINVRKHHIYFLFFYF